MTQSASDNHKDSGIVIKTYRGYGSRQQIFLVGRVFKQINTGSRLASSTFLSALINILRRFLRWGIGDAEIIVRIGDTEHQVFTDRHGYFRINLRSKQLPDPVDSWVTIELELIQRAQAGIKTQARVYVPPASARFVVISDIDDTVMFTGVANKLMMIWRLFGQKADVRIPFPGVISLYKALHAGSSGMDENPMLYVSRGPWGIYEVLDAFFKMHSIPVGPVLFLRDWGLTLQHPLPHRSRGHKLKLIHEMLSLYDEMPFILIGDSGQHDPEIYTQIVENYPDRIFAIYIRNVTRNSKRDQAIKALAKKVAEAGSNLILAADSFTMARHAAEHHLISSESLSDVLKECEMLESNNVTKPTHTMKHSSPQKTKKALKEKADDDTPSNIVVESDIKKS